MRHEMNSRQDARGDVHFNLSWELFVLALAVLSVLNLFLYFLVRSENVAQVVAVIDVSITFVFVMDFLVRLTVASRKRAYFVHGYGWLDLIACLPGFRIIRLVRVVTVTRRIQAGGGIRPSAEHLLQNRARTILLMVVLLTVVVIEFGSMAILAVEENAPNGNIKTASDALWFLVVTISTIGYGDLYPTTNLGRVIGTLILITGVALFTTLTGYLAHFFYGSSDHPLIDRYERRLSRSDAGEEPTET